MSAAQAVGSGARAFQPQRDVALLQLLERTAGRRSFDVDAQSRRIIGQALLAEASGNPPRITIHPADLSSAWLEQVLYARNQPESSQQRECANLRPGERFVHASRTGQ